jgi:catechol-2,3-dioxygenase
VADFYRAALGLTVAREQPGYSVWLALGGAVLMIEQKDAHEPDVPPGSRELVAFAMRPEERDAMRETLRAMGVAVEAETAHTLYFRDPDGRRVAVSSYPLGD